MSARYFPRLHWFLTFVVFSFLVFAVWLCIGYLLPKLLPEISVVNTDKFGIIYRHEKWRGEIRVVGDIWALPGTVVTIEPGTQIIVSSSGDRFNIHWWPWMLKSGLNTSGDKFGVKNGELFWDESQKIQLQFAKLFAVGTSNLPIIFRSDRDQSGSPYDFNLISLKEGVISHAQMSNYRRLVVRNNVTIRDSHFTRIVECAVCIYWTSPQIVNNEFREVSRQAILVIGGSPRITDNLFDQSLPVGITLDPQGDGATVVYHNSFEMPWQVAIKILSGGESLGGSISFNKFSGSSIIQIPCDSRMKILQNEIRGVVRLSSSGNCVGSITLGPNYWASSDRRAVLREKILNKESRFEVLIPTILSDPLPVGRRGN